MTYLVWAAEDTYQGLHGVYNVEIIEADSDDEASEYAAEMSYDIISSYREFQDTIEEEVDNLAEEEGVEYEDDIDQLREEVIQEHMCYNWWKLNDKYTYDDYYQMLRTSSWEDLKDQYAVE